MEKGAKTSSGFSISDEKKSSSLLLSNSEGFGLMKMDGNESFPEKISVMGFQHQGSNLDRPSGGGGSGGESFGRGCSNAMPFDILAPYPITPSKSQGGNMGGSVGYPFTFAQWKELELQAMIYKYMVSSVPVPSDLLFPLSRNYPFAAIDSSSLYNVRYSKNGDPEPGRCKRTDGKKWRCSREVAPHQKYCERHLHRGRPRSRKPVEVKKNEENHKKPRFEKSPLRNSTSSQQSVAASDQPLLLFNAKDDLGVSSAPSYKATNRDLSLMTEVDPTVEAERQWHRLMEANMGSSIYNSNALFHQDYAEQHLLNLSSVQGKNGNLNDAWTSINTLANHANLKNLYPSLNLSISMATGDECRNDHIPKDSRFSSSHPWEPFAQGGPLGEALQLGSGAVGCSTPASPNHSVSPPATAVSSPSGVLHRTLFSHSDGSVCNSPTFVGPMPEFGFSRLN